MSFQIVPVIDLKGGMPVHAVGGHRDQYRPLRSVWQASAGTPGNLAAAVCEGLGLDRIYLADLDAIAGRSRDPSFYEDILPQGRQLWLDAGVRADRSLEALVEIDPSRIQIVVGLESIAGPREIAAISDRTGRDRMIFSLDLDDGNPRLPLGASWPSSNPLAIADEVVGLGVRRIILLDLRRVGTDRGIGNEELLVQLRTRHPEVELTMGGGVRGVEDILRLRDQGASAVLVGSAIHDGRIRRPELDRILGRAQAVP